MQTRKKIFQKQGLCWTVLYHMLSNCSFQIMIFLIIMGGNETLSTFQAPSLVLDSGLGTPLPWSVFSLERALPSEAPEPWRHRTFCPCDSFHPTGGVSALRVLIVNSVTRTLNSEP
jgi:hypothetical protein